MSFDNNRPITQAIIAGVSGNAIDTVQDTSNPSKHRIQTEARLAPGSSVIVGNGVPANPSDLRSDFCKNVTHSENLARAGSLGVPLNYDYSADPAVDLAVNDLVLVFSSDSIEFDNSHFGDLLALTNGVLVQAIIGGVTTTIFNIKKNEDFLRIPGRTPLLDRSGVRDVISVNFSFGGLLKLTAGTTDKVRVVIQDDLLSTKIKHFTATIVAVVAL